jgi:hypothetical protein
MMPSCQIRNLTNRPLTLDDGHGYTLRIRPGGTIAAAEMTSSIERAVRRGDAMVIQPDSAPVSKGQTTTPTAPTTPGASAPATASRKRRRSASNE